MAPVHEVVHSSAPRGVVLRTVTSDDDRGVGGTRGSPSGWGRASPDGTLRRVPRSSNAKPHILVPAFTRDCAYNFVRWKRLRSRYVTERAGGTKRYSPDTESQGSAERYIERLTFP